MTDGSLKIITCSFQFFPILMSINPRGSRSSVIYTFDVS